MVAVTYADLHDLLNITVSDISAINAEKLIDLAVNCLNLYGADLPNMTGTAGSKTLTLESREHGAIFLVARAIFYSYYKSPQSVSVSSISVSASDLLGNSVVMEAVKDAARQLTEIEVDYG